MSLRVPPIGTRTRLVLLAGAAFAAGIVLLPVTHSLAVRILPAAFAQGQDGGHDKYKLITLFGDVFDQVRAEYVEPTNDRDMIENAINGMLTGLDPHSSYMNEKSWKDMQVTTHGSFGGLGIEVTQDAGYIKVISPIDDTPAARAGIKAGDLILSLDGQTVQGLTLNDAVDRMRGPAASKIVLQIKRAGVEKPLEVSMVREVIKIQVVKSHLEGDIGYIRLSSFNEQSDAAIRRAYSQLRAQAGGNLHGIVLDLRNNPGGLLDQAIAVSDDFIDQGEIVSTRARNPADSNRWDAKGGDITNGLPVVLLINGGSASASEIVAGAMQDHRRAVLVGERSFGKGSVQTVIPLSPGNGAMRLTTARYYTPSGRSIQGLGITPDVPVQESRVTEAKIGVEHETDYNHILTNSGGTPQAAAPARTDLPAIAKEIPKLPPEGFPTFDPLKTDTDFQLQQGLAVVRAMSATRHAAR